MTIHFSPIRHTIIKAALEYKMMAQFLFYARVTCIPVYNSVMLTILIFLSVHFLRGTYIGTYNAMCGNEIPYTSEDGCLSKSQLVKNENMHFLLLCVI